MMLSSQYLGVGFIVLAIAVSLLSYFWDQKRVKAYAEFCLTRGFKFEPRTSGGERRFRDVFEDFQRGGSSAWRNTISGEKNGFPFIAFEYVWTAGRHTTQRCGIIWESDAISFPKFHLEPEGILSEIAQVFGMQDIDFADSPDFSDAYRLAGPNESEIRALFATEIRQFFAVTPGQRLVGGGRFLIWWFDSTLPSVSKLDDWLERGDQVRRRFLKA